MGYQVATVILQDGTKYNDLVIVGGIVTKVQGTADIPFQEQEIADIIVNPRES